MPSTSQDASLDDSRPSPPHPNFISRTTTDTAGELNIGRHFSAILEQGESPERSQAADMPNAGNPYEPTTDGSTPPSRKHSLTKRMLRQHDGAHDEGHTRTKPQVEAIPDDGSLTILRNNEAESKWANGDLSVPKAGLGPRPIRKLGTFDGVFVPTCLNVISILMFIRFGFILGQGGVLGTMGMLVASYGINLVTTLSLSAIASNGTVRGGGAYFLISRSLGTEFGGSIGVVFYIGQVLNTGMNAVGLIDCLVLNFGLVEGNWYQVLPDGWWWSYLWSSVVLIICTAICLAGSAIFARASNGLLVILLVATLSIPFSAIILSPFESRKEGIEYTGLSAKTFVENLMPQLTKGAAGSHLRGKETFQDLFGILFPATGGIFAGASMSGDLRKPSKSIPKGTLWGLLTTFGLYTIVIISMAATITRSSFRRNPNIIQDTNISGTVVLAGEFASAFFSTLMGVIGAAKLLQALAADGLLPLISFLGKGLKTGDEPRYAILITYFFAQCTMLLDLNQIASFVTMTYLMTFLVMNLACFLLAIGSAPNFRPSFHFFNWQTAFAGSVLSGAAMFFADGLAATGCVGIIVVIFLIIHYVSPPKSWGDVSQSLIYHQVRKYLLRLRQEHVKFWRPQILLLVNDPRRQYKLIQFCNSMKKGALYILGHVIVTDDFGGSVPEARRQQASWMKFIDFSKIKAFVNIAISPGVEWGVRNIVLSAGLGGMRPNIAVLGFYNFDDLRRNQPLIDITESSACASKASLQNPVFQRQPTRSRRTSKDAKMEGSLPTDACKTEAMMTVTSYVTILEDLLLQLQINVAIAKGFQELEFPSGEDENSMKYIDLWPIQMSAEISSEDDHKQNVLTTNFDTYTLILQLGVILNTVPAWKKAYKLRVAVFVEYESDVEEERGRVKALLENLRIRAEILVFWLASGDLPTYEIIVNGTNPGAEHQEEVEQCLQGQDWWNDLQSLRGNRGPTSASEDLADAVSIFTVGSNWPQASFQQGPKRVERFLGLRRLLKKSKRKHTMSGLNKLGVSLGMRTHRLSDQVMSQHPSNASASEESGSSDEDSDSDAKSSLDLEEEAASEADLDDYESNTESPPVSAAQLKRRRSHGDSMRGPPPSKRSTGQKEVKVPERTIRKLWVNENERPPTSSAPELPSARPETPNFLPPTVSALSASLASLRPTSAEGVQPSTSLDQSSQKAPEKQPSTPKPSSIRERPSMSRHASQPKFSSKPVPITRVATEDGPGPSIMFADTPSPPVRRGRLPSAYHPSSKNTVPDHISEASETSPHTRGSSAYSTQSLPLSFNDLPCRAQHLILNELMRKHSESTAVMFTTLPIPVEGTSQSETASSSYLSDLEVLCKGCPPTLLVHSNSMTVTMSL